MSATQGSWSWEADAKGRGDTAPVVATSPQAANQGWLSSIWGHDSKVPQPTVATTGVANRDDHESSSSTSTSNSSSSTTTSSSDSDEVLESEKVLVQALRDANACSFATKYGRDPKQVPPAKPEQKLQWSDKPPQTEPLVETTTMKSKHLRVRKQLDVVKLKHRSSLKLQDWQRYGYYHIFPQVKSQITKRMAQLDADFQAWRQSMNGVAKPIPFKSTASRVSFGIDRVHCKDLTVQQFWDQFEKPNKPVMIQGLTDSWPAKEKWTVDNLLNGPYRERLFKCGEDDDGHSCKVPMKTFIRYMRYQKELKDDSPLYVFDDAFDEDRVAKEMLNDYTIPKYFDDDLFHLVGDKRRPPHRWVLVGPERSGSGLHIDPLATSAWNTLLSGRKLWVLFKPGARKRVVKGSALKLRSEDGEPATWFINVVPRIRAREELKENPQELGMMEFIQHPGETIFVPGGWWHAVLNLDDTVAVTQNFCSRINFERVWVHTRRSRRHMAKRWLSALEKDFPWLVEQAHQLNERDNFKMLTSGKKKIDTSKDEEE